MSVIVLAYSAKFDKPAVCTRWQASRFTWRIMNLVTRAYKLLTIPTVVLKTLLTKSHDPLSAEGTATAFQAGR